MGDAGAGRPSLLEFFALQMLDIEMMCVCKIFFTFLKEFWVKILLWNRWSYWVLDKKRRN